jgi:hypothetical protein
MHIWKCHSETPCVTIINKQNYLLKKNEGQEGKTGSVPGLAPVGKGWA